jgi:phospholipid-transporting ATPase
LRVFTFGARHSGELVEPDAKGRLKKEKSHNHTHFCGNDLATTKYTPLTFLPINLYEQFRRFANVYFLFTALLQLFFSHLSPLNPVTSYGPLFLVLGVTALKEAWEDIKRARSDSTINNRPIERFSFASRKFQQVRWKDVHPGDIIRITEDASIPCDCIILKTNTDEGSCYIETAGLDGETNLKIRQSVLQTVNKRDLLKKDWEVEVKCERPNLDLHNFKGKIIPHRAQPIPVSNDGVLLRGCVLKNTSWVWAVAIYTGEDTKLAMNSTNPPSKRSFVEIYANKILLQMFGFLFFVIATTTVFAMAFNASDSGPLSLQGHSAYLTGLIAKPEDWATETVERFFTFLILFTVMIPISLYVTLEVVKLGLAYFMVKDKDMYYEETGTPLKVKTSNLPEELGQIKHIFSDKTGTLTRNIMEFMKCTIDGETYGFLAEERSQSAKKGRKEGEGGSSDSSSESSGDQNDEEYDEEKYGDPDKFWDPKLLAVLNGDDSDASKKVHDFLLLLAICHTVIPEVDGDEITYQAASPDESAFVRAMKDLGYVFHKRKRNEMSIHISNKRFQGSLVYKVHAVNEFNSTRKRMSVLVETPDGRYFLMTKGADNVMFNLCLSSDTTKAELKARKTTEQQLQDFSVTGLRTLVLAQKELSPADFKKFSDMYYDATVSIDDREAKLDACAEYVETGMSLVGATAIEDKLQHGVPEAIERLAAANIKVWVLTGDKQETAINIGRSCRLLISAMDLIIINSKGSGPEAFAGVQKLLNRANKQIKKAKKGTIFGLVIDGPTLSVVSEMKAERDLLEIAMASQAVVCCRVSPAQKSEVVELVKRNEPTSVTLAIGDGANDVSMIQSAHLGIGISGEEGMQAVNASDYAIAQFRFLEKLILVHGHWNYRRVVKVILYSFYKNIAFAMSQVLFLHFTLWSGATLYDSISIAAYNTIFTSLPILFIGIFDRNVSENMLLELPILYKAGQDNKSFTPLRFWYWVVHALFTSVWITLIVHLLIGDGCDQSPDGKCIGSRAQGLFAYTLLLMSVTGKLALETRYWTLGNHIATWGSIVLWFAWVAFYSGVFMPWLSSNVYGVVFELYDTANFWFAIPLVSFATLLPDLTIKFVKHSYFPEGTQIAREMELLATQREDQKARSAEKDHEHAGFNNVIGGEIEGQEYEKHGYAFSQERGQRDWFARKFLFKKKKEWAPPVAPHLGDDEYDDENDDNVDDGAGNKKKSSSSSRHNKMSKKEPKEPRRKQPAVVIDSSSSDSDSSEAEDDVDSSSD